MERDFMGELMDIGSIVDELDTSLIESKSSNAEDVLMYVTTIEEKFELIDVEQLDTIQKIVYLYTKANYRAILQHISYTEFEQLQEVSKLIRQSEGYDDFAFQNFALRIKDYREAISLSKENDKLSPVYASQIYVNLANVYNEMGRTVESIEELKKVENLVDRFPMARANLAIKHLSLSEKVTNRSVMRYLIEMGISELDDVCNNVTPDGMPIDTLGQFKKWKRYMEEVVDTSLSDVDSWSVQQDVDDDYKAWSASRNLTLNYLNIIYNYGNVDDVQMIDMGLGYFRKENNMEYYSWFNTIKQEYNMARYFLYQIDTLREEANVHESQRYNVLINTLDYPALGYRTELLKVSLKTAFSVLDKIGLFCCKFHNQQIPTYRIDFHKWYKEIELEVALASPFNALYWLSKDLDRKAGNMKVIRLLRNCIEHRFVRVLDLYDIPLDEELADDKKYEYTVSYSNLLNVTYETLRLVRNAIFYMANGFNIEYNRIYYGDKSEGIFVPLYLHTYDDEWKN
ncbi:hypothetical protein KK120_19470 [Virgibacillus dakarensis]|uniref:LA2681 family HEPN domain-containing protein n=1 Tax=Cytobacillus kochii TaxID=859143 RepID=UPI000C8524D7|nr:LA2681 family HEPN domain-containing protein [Cytobacillus kochii]MBT2217986.1 hypothetical protein [Virgibacillus dakarensis]MCA1025047.1 hypothetical protein [Cytobacillus kochii]